MKPLRKDFKYHTFLPHQESDGITESSRELAPLITISVLELNLTTFHFFFFSIHQVLTIIFEGCRFTTFSFRAKVS